MQKIIWLPFRWRYVVNICGLVFVPKQLRGRLTWQTICHERIHTAQMIELGYIGFYLLYILEWLFRLVFHTKTAYRGISFEREAYDHEGDGWEYINTRKHFAQWRRNCQKVEK